MSAWWLFSFKILLVIHDWGTLLPLIKFLLKFLAARLGQCCASYKATTRQKN
jgi:hypothetical protein